MAWLHPTSRHPGSPARSDDRLSRDRSPDSANPCTLAFDLLRIDDTMLVDEPYARRRELLERLKPANPRRLAVPPAISPAERAAGGLSMSDLLDVARERHPEDLS